MDSTGVSLVTISGDLNQGFNMVLRSPPANASDGGARAEDPGEPGALGMGVMDQEMSQARVEYARRVLAKEVKSVFMPEDLQRLKKHAWQTETPTSAYLLQCEGVIRAKMSSASASENVAVEVEQLLLLPPRPLTAWARQEDLTDPAAWLLRAGQAFLYFISHTVSKLEEVENLKQAQADLQTLYRDFMDALERAAVAETKGVAKEKMLWVQQKSSGRLRQLILSSTGGRRLWFS